MKISFEISLKVFTILQNTKLPELECVLLTIEQKNLAVDDSDIQFAEGILQKYEVK